MPTLWAVVSLVWSLFATISTGDPVDTYTGLQSRQSSVSVVSGISWRDEHGNVAVRREARDLKANHPEQWSLYLLGLSSLQWLDQSDPLSYYGLASIHGRPYKTWGDVPGVPSKSGTAGYCTHANALFLPWHRPYLALFEEQVYKRVQHYAEEATEDVKERYQAAANSFRLPYWDWALGEGDGPIPDFFTAQMINVTRPNGQQQELWNPLYAFYFHPLVPGDFESKWANQNETLRWPSNDSFNAVSDQQAMQDDYKIQQRSLHDHVAQAYRTNTLEAFSHTIEEAHGWIHGIIGGGWNGKRSTGHMWPLEYSAYEPMFMLHHANVDRLYAIYQAQHPDRPLQPSNIGQNGNVWLENDATVNGNTSLLPFRKASGGFWTPNDVEMTETFGYAYPETFKAAPHMNEYVNEHEGEDEEDEEDAWEDEEEDWDLSARASASVARLYSPSARNMLTANPATAGGTVQLVTNGTFTDWAIGTEALAHELPSTFIVRFLLTGDFSSDPSVDVGSWVNAMPQSHEEMRKRTATTEQTYKSSISLTSSLLDQIKAGKLESLDAKDVVPYLTDKLSWRVLKGDGTSLPQKDLGPLTFEVVSTKAHIPQDADKPISYSEKVVKHPEVTSGKAGGVAA
ncbi:hypothetical protein HBI24_137470 [Parastagonospora nodorum]|nr:hypothetical protein HBI05_019530 [Parastagonospora nodorum]KAH4311708.1 hypothetical protein HBI01_012260 [Parastagonospora nodorum]KAH4316709.1 hypothetical protein HBI02_028580 [Parastagonospora nodorum]KAH4328322.1 hypothetical protein HBI00_111680 [Parastagonospora nodorum]KAH4387961.1 hypothetical protein HBH94_028460 [Parastagonospora nodorum]